ncbi:tyrosine-type recombinase/integrase [Streptomyces sp. R11]|uniref:Tyrosine-type recombinase/integrase n=1 Tax=Streptomyces sp. R11 TaxID=3238625 RepID=A0AB39NC95_9ACTN
MTTAPLPEDTGGRWCSPIDLKRYERSPGLSEADLHAIRRLDLRNLRRLRYHDPDAPQWAALSRLLHPLQDVNVGFDTPPTMHMRRAMNDAVAVLLLRCADSGRSYWEWTRPRVIADDVWAKLLGAGLNLQSHDLPRGKAGLTYPLELVRAVTLTWLFAGQRSNEIARLRLGCIRWQYDGAPVAGNAMQVLARDAICLLDVPAHKTGTAFTKPVDPLLGQAINAWEALRPAQPKRTDRRTGEQVDLLFSYRARAVSSSYINSTITPMLCRKAGVPDAEVRGSITSHRARSTIASQPYNAKEPMTLFELQAWLGHRSPESTQHYAKISPSTLTKAYKDAGYFARNVRTIEVLVDREAVESGAAAAGEPWQHYDLGHGFCSYTFFEQCPHRMACARCDFYTPKDSSKGQLLEAKDNLHRMLASIPLTDEEQAAVADGRAAIDRLLKRLADVPTPSGATPRQLLPIVELPPS